MVREILIFLGKPGYQLIIFSLTIFGKLIKFLKNLLNSVRSYLLTDLWPKIKLGKKRGPGRPRNFRKQIKLKIQKIFKKLKKRKRGRPRKKEKIILRNKKLALILIIIGIILILAGIIISLFRDLPSPDHLIQRRPSLTTKIYDRSGILLYKIYRDQNRTLVPLENISQHLIAATIAIEDKEFYSHSGLSWRGILRALKHNFLNPDKPQMGGSTLTQQLVKNALLNSEKTWKRKIREAILALLVEMKFSKNEILQMYFNEVPYGGTAYGSEEAAQKYFGKHVWEINPAEAALLAGLTRAPTKYSPFGAYPEFAKKRQEQVIREMVKTNYINPSEAAEIITTPLRFIPKRDSIKAPHFVFYIKDLLVDYYGQQAVEQGGLEVTTSLDWTVQQLVEKTVRDELNKLTHLNIKNGAALIINPKTGGVLAMAGSRDYFNFENDGNVNVVLRPRQPGSAIKVINYAVALGMGYTTATIIPDTPITYRIPGQPPYSPRNYDNQFHGNLPLRTALASSFNVPAVKVLSSYGVDRMIKMGQTLGITTWDDPSRFGLSLTLGGGEVKMIDLAQVYSILANLGKKVDINPILEIKNHRGKTIFQNPCLTNNSCPNQQVIDPGIAFTLTDILTDNQARALAFGNNSFLQIPNYKVAVKTGTTNNLRDNWCIGYTPSLLTAVWVGNNDNSPMSHVASGVTGATPIWHQIMKQLLNSYPQEDWLVPDNVVKTAICQTTGTLPCFNCPKIIEEYFIAGTQPTKHCQLMPTPAPTLIP